MLLIGGGGNLKYSHYIYIIKQKRLQLLQLWSQPPVCLGAVFLPHYFKMSCHTHLHDGPAMWWKCKLVSEGCFWFRRVPEPFTNSVNASVQICKHRVCDVQSAPGPGPLGSRQRFPQSRFLHRRRFGSSISSSPRELLL